MKSFLFLILSALILTGCSSKSDQDYLKAADQHMQEKNVPEALKSYNELLKEYPDSKLAPEAMEKIAVLYQNKLVKGLTEEQSLEKAASMYRQVFDKFPESTEAPKALFMSAFILANDLGKYDEATKAYKLFLEKFPDNQLAESAQQELNNMGKDPNDIIKRNNSKNI